MEAAHLITSQLAQQCVRCGLGALQIRDLTKLRHLVEAGFKPAPYTRTEHSAAVPDQHRTASRIPFEDDASAVDALVLCRIRDTRACYLGPCRARSGA